MLPSEVTVKLQRDDPSGAPSRPALCLCLVSPLTREARSWPYFPASERSSSPLR